MECFTTSIRRLFSFITLLPFLISPLLAQQTIRYLPPEDEFDPRSEYFIRVLELALQKSQDKYGAFTLQKGSKNIDQTVVLKQLREGQEYEVVHTMTHVGRERLLRPIRIPLTKGLLGLRLLLVRKDDVGKFSKNMDEAELKNQLWGQGSSWPDTQILELNGYRVEKIPQYHDLFLALKEGKIDAFPRSVIEIYDELLIHQSQLAVAPGIAIRYDAPVYFFVSPQNKELAERLEFGLKKALYDGSFNRLFDSYLGKHVKRAELEKRKIIQIKNPLLSAETPLNQKELWYQFE